MIINKSHNGRIFIRNGSTQLVAWKFSVSIYDEVGIVQLDNGEKYTPPVELKKPGDEKTFCIGDYEITVKRAKQKTLSIDGMIDLKKARLWSKLNHQEEGKQDDSLLR